MLQVLAVGSMPAAEAQEAESVWMWSDSLGTWAWLGLGEWSQSSTGSWRYCFPQWDELVGWSTSCGAALLPQLQALGAA